MSETVGLVGLGNMGQAMARRLVEQGWNLCVWNRGPEKAEPVVRLGATRAQRPEDAAEPGGIVTSMLADDQAVSEIFGGGSKLPERLGAGGLHVSMSTIHPETARGLGAARSLAGGREQRSRGLGLVVAVAGGRRGCGSGKASGWQYVVGKRLTARKAPAMVAKQRS